MNKLPNLLLTPSLRKEGALGLMFSLFSKGELMRDFALWLAFVFSIFAGHTIRMNFARIQQVLALSESQKRMPADTLMNAVGYTGVNISVGSSTITLGKDANWWNIDYNYKKQLTVKNTGTTQLTTNANVQVYLHANILGLGTTKLQADFDDLRVIYAVGTSHTEINRTVSADIGNTALLTITFPLQTNIGVTATNTNYYLYYGNGSAGSPPSANGYSIGAATATFVAPFNGSTTAIVAGGTAAPTTATGAIRYSTKSAMSFNGVNNLLTLSRTINLSNLDWTIEMWARPETTAFGGILPGYIGGVCYMRIVPGGIYLCGISASITAGWHHVAFTHTTSNNYVKIFVDGSLAAQGTAGSELNNLSFSEIGRFWSDNTYAYKGILEEIRVSDTIRYLTTFTPQTTPFISDANTKLLLHFDENGDDPRLSGKAFDSSGNGNHGTITGAKYVSGLIGVDQSDTTVSGYYNPQTSMSHSGVMIEEGTTNLILNPSFENGTYSLNWAAPYMNLGTGVTTFTANMAKRNSAGPFAAGPLVQGKLADGTSSDIISFSPGSQISGLFNRNFDAYQGSVVFWVTPEWNGNDGISHPLMSNNGGANPPNIYKDGTGKLIFSWWVTGVLAQTDVSSWTAGSTYLVIARWNSYAPIDGTNYASITVNNVTTFGKTSSFTTAQDGHYKIGASWNGQGSAQAIFEGFTVYRRPLYTAAVGATPASGIDVGNGDEISQIYNSGSGKDPTLVTGSWDVVFALPTNATTGTLTSGVGITGEAWSHPHGSNLVGGTAANGFMMNGTYTADGFGTEVPTTYTPYGTGTTAFTPNVALRTPPAGPFAKGVYVGGLYNTLNQDRIVTSVGVTVAGSNGTFTNIFDRMQGSVVLWVTPEWNGNDGQIHVLFHNVSYYLNGLYKNASSQLCWDQGWSMHYCVDVSNWVAGNTYNVVARWDRKNPIYGSNYTSISINGVHAFGQTANETIHDGGNVNSNNIGNDTDGGATKAWSQPANAIIQGLTVYRRVLYEATTPSGINVGNGDEISQIYNGGTGKDPTLVTGSWDVVFALPTDSTSLNLGTGGTGQAWSHPHSSNLLGAGGFLMGAGVSADGWGTTTPLLYDTFTDGNGTSLAAHTPDVSVMGQGWTGYVSGSSIVSNMVTSGIYSNNGAPVINVGTTNYTASVTIRLNASGSVSPRGLVVRGNAAGNDYYIVALNQGTSLFEIVDQAGTTLASTSYPVATGVDYDLRASVYGSTITATLNGANSITTNSATKTGTYVGTWGRYYGDFFDTLLVLPVTSLSASEKIFAGGYKFTSNATDQGIYKDMGTTAGNDFVVRAMANSDGVSIPKIILYDQSNGAEIGSMVGTTASTKASPDVFIFSGEAPAGCTSVRIKLINTQATGTVYWHQVEVLNNLILNPSFDNGWSGADPNIPTGWSNYSLASGNSSQELSIFHSGRNSLKFLTSGRMGMASNNMWANGKYYGFGGFIRKDAGDIRAGSYNGKLFGQNSLSTVLELGGSGPSFVHSTTVGRATMTNDKIYLYSAIGSTGYVDDLYSYQLSDVSLTVTPATTANSTETTGLRVDGADAHTSTISTLNTGNGVLRFVLTPRHSWGIGASFGVVNPVIVHAVADNNNQIKLQRQNATTLQLITIANGTTTSIGWTSPTLNAGTTYAIEIGYSGSTNLYLKVNNVQVGSTNTMGLFSTAPTTVYWGTDNGGANSNPYDATYAVPPSPAAVAALATGEKIYPGGYKTTTDLVNTGIYSDITTTGGSDFVIRAVANSDGTCIPKATLYDQTGGAEIGHLDGTIGAGRTNPSILLFTGEMPGSGTKTLRVKLTNASTSPSTCYWHQVEVLNNLIKNPSFEIGTSASGPWVPTNWNLAAGVSAVDSTQETTKVWSGNSSYRWSTAASSGWGGITQTTSTVAGKFYSGGVRGYKSGNNPEASFNALSFPLQTNSPVNSWNPWFYLGTGTLMTQGYSVFRSNNTTNGSFGFDMRNGGSNYGIVDDLYLFSSDPVGLAVTPATQANSSESTGLRVDGADTLTMPITGLSATSGIIKFRFTPRYDFSVAANFGYSTTPTILALFNDGSNRLYLQKNGTALLLRSIFGGTIVDTNYTSASLTPGVTHDIQISYQTGGNLALKIDNVQVGSTNIGVGLSFTNIPTTAYFGSDQTGGLKYDGTFTNFVTSTVTQNNTASYYKFGSNSVKIINSGTLPDEYETSSVGASGTTYALSAYVYDGASVGATVSSSTVSLAVGTSALTTTYADVGGGWTRLTGTVLGTGITMPYGVQVGVGKTIYVDGIQLEQKSYSTTYADGSMGTGYAWGGTANNSSSTRTAGNLIYSTAGNISYSAGAISLWVKPNYSQADVNFGSAARKFLYTTNVASGGYLSLRYDPGNSVFYFATNLAGIMASNPGAVVKDKWYHTLVSWDANGNISFFVNNILAGTAPAAMPNTLLSTIELDVGPHTGTNLDGTFSDFRIYNSAIGASQVAQLYNSGLATHQIDSSEGVAKYASSGEYQSPVVDLGANGQWGTTPIALTHDLGIGGSVAYLTRTSADNSTWNDWVSQIGSSIVSQPLRYFQWKALLSAGISQASTPTISNMVVSYVEDTNAPVNPTDTALGYSSGVGTTALTSGSWYHYLSPTFAWGTGVDTAASGQSASGVASYTTWFQNSDTGSTSCTTTKTDSDRTMSCTFSTNGTYLLKLTTQDNSGNTSTPVTLFTYNFDKSDPPPPASVSTTTIGYSAVNQFTFFWPSVTDLGPAGVVGYEYKTGVGDTSALADWQFTTATSVLDIPAYTEGANTFYVRAVDAAGNRSTATTNNGTAAYYYNKSAPTAPRNVIVSPLTSSGSPAATNSFTITWDKPETYSGEIAKYYYCVNCTPSANTMTQTTGDETVLRKILNQPLATQQGKNTFYLVAEDNNINMETGKGNVNFEAYAQMDFYAATVAPGAPTNLTIIDASDRSASKWRLTLAWDIGTTLGVDHYEIYRSTDNETYTRVGSVTGMAYTDGSLLQSHTYYYKVKSFDNAGSSSIYSPMVSSSPEGRYTDPPSAGGIPSVVTGSSTATIKWSTGRDAYGSVEYGKTSGYGLSSNEATADDSHSIKVTGLAPGETYHYRVQSLDDSNLVGYERADAYSTDYTFTTLSAPSISGVVVSDIALDSVVINWKTLSTTSSKIDYGLTTEYGSTMEVSTSADENHLAKLTGLKDSSLYHYRIKATDVDGNIVASDDYTFFTITFPQVTAYVLKTDQSAGGTVISLAWASNVPVSSLVEYLAVEVKDNQYTTEELIKMNQTELAQVPVVVTGDPLQIASATLSLTHVNKIENLKDGVIYIIRLKGRDQYGNEAVSDPIRYVTSRDSRPPIIANTTVESQLSGNGTSASAQLIVSWETDEPSTTQVLYGAGVGTEYQQSTEAEVGLTKQHTVVIHNLQPTTSYHLQIVSKDKAGNQSTSGDLIAVTPAISESALDVVLQNLQDVFGFLKI